MRAALDRAKRASVPLAVEIRAGFMASLPVAAGFGALQVIDFGEVSA